MKMFNIKKMTKRDQAQFESAFASLQSTIVHVGISIESADNPVLFAKALRKAYKGQAYAGNQDIICEDVATPDVINTFFKLIRKLRG